MSDFIADPSAPQTVATRVYIPETGNQYEIQTGAALGNNCYSGALLYEVGKNGSKVVLESYDRLRCSGPDGQLDNSADEEYTEVSKNKDKVVLFRGTPEAATEWIVDAFNDKIRERNPAAFPGTPPDPGQPPEEEMSPVVETLTRLHYVTTTDDGKQFKV